MKPGEKFFRGVIREPLQVSNDKPARSIVIWCHYRSKPFPL